MTEQGNAIKADEDGFFYSESSPPVIHRWSVTDG